MYFLLLLQVFFKKKVILEKYIDTNKETPVALNNQQPNTRLKNMVNDELNLKNLTKLK